MSTAGSTARERSNSTNLSPISDDEHGHEHARGTDAHAAQKCQRLLKEDTPDGGRESGEGCERADERESRIPEDPSATMSTA
eukprot:CAMPEP_0184390928 /NCGR_PEP_ID=MMETSP0007-20130409/13706_1 /TAXON_ID=97485 /ORGANISM="Prymnesium parvum, Strain Texoma1" /LENGTH=81 /DNA_ID=CAMNT_0026740867 /DNA_START=796 /DNA_END=1037 /DNA_ORIENTATION=-